MPLLAKLYIVGNLSNNNLQAQTIAVGTIFKLHNNWNISEVCIKSSLFRILYPDLTVYCWCSTPSQPNLSCPFTFQLTLEIMVIICTSRFFSHSNLSLHQLRFQLRHRVVLLPSHSTRSPTILSLFWEIEYNLGNSSSKI